MIEPEPLLSNPDKRILDVAGTRAFLVERKIEPLRLENWPSPKAVLFVLDESYRIEGYRGWLEHRIPTMARLSNVIFDPLLPSVLEDKAPGSAETVEFKITSKGRCSYCPKNLIHLFSPLLKKV